MVDEHSSIRLLKALFILCFVALILPVIALAGWLLLSTMAWGWPIPRIIILFVILFVSQVLALVLYFKRPWVALIVGWLGAVLIVTHAIPWDDRSLHSFLHQFGFEIVYFLAAHVGLGAYLLLKKMTIGGWPRSRL